MRRDAIRALSLANLCYMAAWSRLIAQSLDPLAQFTRYNLSEYQAILINVPLLTAAFWAGMTLARRSGSTGALRLAEWSFLLVLIVPINGVLRTQLPGFSLDQAPNPFESPGGVMWLAVTPVGASLLVRFRPTMVRLLGTVVLAMSPFALMTFAQAAWLMTKFEDRPPAAHLPATRSAPRILWLVFDEMDDRLAFARRPPTIRLPELDRLRAEALWAREAYSPARFTLRSMPALITGKLVADVTVAHPSELSVKFHGSEKAVPWSAEPNVFSRAREAGYNTALTGWYHPYCRIIGHTVTRCTNRDEQATLLASAREQVRSLIDTVPLAARLIGWGPPWPEISPGASRSRYQATLADARQWATDPDLGLVLVHWGFPHRPIFYDRYEGRLEPSERSNYFDNLALVDRTLGELRRAMQQAGMWDPTIVLVTSDHQFRPGFFQTESPAWPPEENAALNGPRDAQVPFILKLSGQEDAVRYDPPFNTVLTHDLMLALLRREVSSPASVVSWLDRHRSIGRSPYE
jgi:hypothetical protein